MIRSCRVLVSEILGSGAAVLADDGPACILGRSVRRAGSAPSAARISTPSRFRRSSARSGVARSPAGSVSIRLCRAGSAPSRSATRSSSRAANPTAAARRSTASSYTTGHRGLTAGKSRPRGRMCDGTATTDAAPRRRTPRAETLSCSPRSLSATGGGATCAAVLSIQICPGRTL